MVLAVPFDLEPMESEPVDELPTGEGWQFEPKWDGFRSLAFCDSSAVHLQSRNQKPLDRYFPELIEGLRAVPVSRFVLDGEIVIPGQAFETLQLRLHPAATRISHSATALRAS
jgi:ATP-dependent DNA ligase